MTKFEYYDQNGLCFGPAQLFQPLCNSLNFFSGGEKNMYVHGNDY